MARSGPAAASVAAGATAAQAGFAPRLEALLARHWWQPRPTWLARLLLPLAWLHGALLRAHRRHQPAAEPTPVPLLVVGNFIVGGAGKTPTVIAIVQALQAAGYRPGVVSRGHGRQGDGVQAVPDDASADAARTVGDEPLLIQRRTGVPVWVGRDRGAAARALCTAHAEVDVLVADDGLQHHRLARRAELVVFDERGAGNGLLLPAGPLRGPLPHALPPGMHVLYTAGQASTALPGTLAQRRITHAWPLAAWHMGDSSARMPLDALRGRPLLAVAGLATPAKFFGMLQAAGLSITSLPLPDHHAYASLPWPAGTADVVTTEKDAVKLVAHALGRTRVWVVPLDLELPAGLVNALLPLLFDAASTHPPPLPQPTRHEP